MVIQLSDLEIRDLFSRECYGHLACTMRDARPYLVPTTYVYKDHAVYCFSFGGQKLDCMRSNPLVCFQVQDTTKEDEWESVIAWGRYTELSGTEREDALALLIEKLWKEGTKQHSIYFPFRDSEQTMRAAMRDEGCVLFKIELTEMTGRREKCE